MDTELTLKLEAYCRANENAERLPIVRKAIDEYIDQRLVNDEKMNARYEDARKDLLLNLPAGLRVVRFGKGET
jgi:hypothetical protein